MKWLIYNLLGLVALASCEGEMREAERLEDRLMWPDSVQINLANSDSMGNDTVIDADYSLLEAKRGSEAPEDILELLALVDVRYYGFDSLPHKGQILVHEDLEKDVRTIFDSIYKWGYPIERVVPIIEYKWDDDTSMFHNNTSAFNYRKVPHMEKLSDHSYGQALDINPRYNPYYSRGGIMPRNAIHDTSLSYTLTADHRVVRLFQSKGWGWGGLWTRSKDFQHFYKKVYIPPVDTTIDLEEVFKKDTATVAKPTPSPPKFISRPKSEPEPKKDTGIKINIGPMFNGDSEDIESDSL